MAAYTLDAPVLSGFYGRVRCEPGWCLDASWSAHLTDFDLWLVWAGRGTMKIGRRTHALRPGTCLWMRPGHRYLATQDPDDRLGVSFTHFTLPRARADFRPPFEITTVRSLEFAAAALAEVVRLRGESSALAPALMGNLLQILARDHRRHPTAVSPAQARRRQAVHALTARIAAEPGRDWNVADLARETGYAVDHFSKSFAAITGLRPQAFIVQARLDRARQLLAETSLTVTEIAAALGFGDVYFFSRQFRQKCGRTPTAYRQTCASAPLDGALPAQIGESST